jgi:hypothetical protein
MKLRKQTNIKPKALDFWNKVLEIKEKTSKVLRFLLHEKIEKWHF